MTIRDNAGTKLPRTLLRVEIDTSYVPSVDYEAQVLATQNANLLGYYRLGESSGATQAIDETGNSYDSVAVSNVTWEATGAISDGDTAAQFSGAIDSYIKLETQGAPASRFRAANFTIMCWFRRTGAGVEATTSGGADGFPAADGIVPLVTKGRGEGEGGGVNCNWFLGLNDGTGNIRIAGDFESLTGPNHKIVGTTNISNDTWYMATLTYDGSELKIYLNDSLENTVSTSDTADNTSQQPACIGTCMNTSGGAAGGFAGQIDEVAIWDTALTLSEISDIYDAA